MFAEIQIDEGFTIGYRNRLAFGAAVASPLASAKRRLRLGSGRHLLLARNGRGKTTLLKTLAGLLPGIGGTFTVNGRVLFVHEELSFDAELSAKQIFASFFNAGERAMANQYAERLELDQRKPFGRLSKGNRQKVILVLAETYANAGRARVLLMDEPFSGLDYFARQQIDKIWSENHGGVLRLVCVHPDEPTLQAQSALLIRDGEIDQVEVDGQLDWVETRKCLN